MTQAEAKTQRRKKQKMPGKQKSRTSKEKKHVNGQLIKRKATKDSLVPSRKKKASTKQKKLLQNQAKKRRTQRIVNEIIIAATATGCLIWMASLLFFSIIKVDGYGMLPTLGEGDTVFVSRKSAIRRFDLVAIRPPDGKGVLIRRIIGLSGETVIYKQDRLYVNSDEKEEIFIAKQIEQADASNSYYTNDFSVYQLTKEQQIAAGKYLVLGDNRPYSSDSRYYGLIDEAAIIGVVEMRIFPLHQMTKF